MKLTASLFLAIFVFQSDLLATDLMDAPGRGYREMLNRVKQHDLLFRFPGLTPDASSDIDRKPFNLSEPFPTKFEEPAWLSKEFPLPLHSTAPLRSTTPTLGGGSLLK